MNRDLLERQLILHEGFRNAPYVDTENNWTIGVGYNITGRGWAFLNKAVGRFVTPADGMTEKALLLNSEVMLLLRADIARVEAEVKASWPPYEALNDARQRVCLDMAFNLGLVGAGRFHKAIAAMARRDWTAAAMEMFSSKWAKQVGKRAERLSHMVLTGQDPDPLPPLPVHVPSAQG